MTRELKCSSAGRLSVSGGLHFFSLYIFVFILWKHFYLTKRIIFCCLFSYLSVAICYAANPYQTVYKYTYSRGGRKCPFLVSTIFHKFEIIGIWNEKYETVAAVENGSFFILTLIINLNKIVAYFNLNCSTFKSKFQYDFV